MRISSVPILIVASLVAIGSAAEAKPVFKTKYTYYVVGGDSAEDIYKAMLSKGPRVKGAKAYASISATITQDAKLTQAKSCRIENYRLNIDFNIKLPRVKNEQVLPAADRSFWQQFSSFLKKHEVTHRSLWLRCVADLERQVAAIKATTCGNADKKAASLLEKIDAECSKKHNAFDAAEQKKLMKHPFVKLVYTRTTRSVHAAEVP